MKNTHFNYQSIYKMIREAYVDSFPYPCFGTPEYILEKYLQKWNLQGHIESIDSAFKFIPSAKDTPNPQKRITVIDEAGNVKTKLEELLKDDKDLSNLIADIVQMKSWLIDNNFITDTKVATEKMLDKVKF